MWCLIKWNSLNLKSITPTKQNSQLCPALGLPITKNATNPFSTFMWVNEWCSLQGKRQPTNATVHGMVRQTCPGFQPPLDHLGRQEPCAVDNLLICTLLFLLLMPSLGPSSPGMSPTHFWAKNHSTILKLIHEIPGPRCTLVTMRRLEDRLQGVQGMLLLDACTTWNTCFPFQLTKQIEQHYMKSFICYRGANSNSFIIFIFVV